MCRAAGIPALLGFVGHRINTTSRAAAISVTLFVLLALTGIFTGLAVGMPVFGTNIPNGATIASITNGTTFVLNTAAYANTSAAPIATAFATTVNHGYQLLHYDLAGAELGPQTKIRFQAAGYTPTSPTRSPQTS